MRNDDIYSFRWADLDYARAFIKAIPGPDKIAGFYMGPDGYLWGRDFLTKDAGGPRQTVMQKQWLSFTLWGRLAYEPDLPAATFQRLIAARFPGADVPKLTAAWADASKTFPYITRFFWGDIDVKWFPEACRRKSGFYTVRHFIEGGTMPGAGVLNIIEWRTGLLAAPEARRRHAAGNRRDPGGQRHQVRSKPCRNCSAPLSLPPATPKNTPPRSATSKPCRTSGFTTRRRFAAPATSRSSTRPATPNNRPPPCSISKRR